MTEVNKKITILTISDHPLSPSGVGTQTRYIFHELLKTGKYRVVSLGGAVSHQDYRPQKTQEFGDDWLMIPVDGYGNPDIVRSIIRTYRPDILWFMTDPRFYTWLWQIENEIRPLVPMVYYHVWDNFPEPHFNKSLYDSNDCIVTISKLTSELVNKVSPSVKEVYIPHAVDTDIFKKVDSQVLENFKQQNFPNLVKNRNCKVFFWNNRNARRKQSGTLVWWFKEFLDKVGHDKACLLMHTDAKDPHGQDLNVLIRDLGLAGTRSIMLSQEKLPSAALALMYNVAHCTINISDAEGFGLGTLESLACETPILVNMTGGLQEQVTRLDKVTHEQVLKRNSEKPGVSQYEHGFGIEPNSKAVIGSQGVPYIYEDRISKDHFIEACERVINLPEEERLTMGKNGRKFLLENYNFKNFINSWDEILTKVHEENGSWETRKNYNRWKMIEI